MNSAYYEAIDRMGKKGVDPEYVNGWASGFLHNPKREEQRVNEAYEAKDNRWKLLYRAGKSAVDAARVAAEEWLKALGA